MSVILFKDGGSQKFDEYTFTDRLNEGWSLTEGGEVEATVIDEDPVVDVVVDDTEASQGDIIAAIELLDADNTEHWTSTGKPMVAAIETVLGKPITSKQRDEAWKTKQGE